jgi:alpha-beta hydrolase superfamily lysophospholipase
MFPGARDGKLTRSEYDLAVGQDATIGMMLPFGTFDLNSDGEITSDEPPRVVKPRLDAILKWVEERDDASLARAVVGLSSAYLLEDWNAEPNHKHLLVLNIPLVIFHGELDGATRAEGVREAEAALRAAGRTNLAVHFYPDGNHDLNWTWQSAQQGGPRAFRDAFDTIARLVRDL